MTAVRPLVKTATGGLREVADGETLVGAAGGSGFRPIPDDTDDTDLLYFYYGWEVQGDGWLIQRQQRSNSATLSATTGAATYEQAWTSRTSLTYT